MKKILNEVRSSFLEGGKAIIDTKKGNANLNLYFESYVGAMVRNFHI